MQLKKKSLKKNPLTKAQNGLLRDSLKKLLGNGLLSEKEMKPSEVKSMVIKDALNAIVLNS